MPYAPQTEFRERAQRVGFEEKTPVVVRFPGGVRCSAQLQVISVTGGLLCLQRPVQPGAVGKLMFLTNKGCIAGEAQMLTPVAWDRQPFKFTTLLEQDHYRLQTIIKRQLSSRSSQSGAREAAQRQLGYRTNAALVMGHQSFLLEFVFSALFFYVDSQLLGFLVKMAAFQAKSL